LKKEIGNLRSWLLHVQAKYDGGGMPHAIYAVCQKLEREIAWLEQKEQQTRAQS
jgi:hypothetical protein